MTTVAAVRRLAPAGGPLRRPCRPCLRRAALIPVVPPAAAAAAATATATITTRPSLRLQTPIVSPAAALPLPARRRPIFSAAAAALGQVAAAAHGNGHPPPYHSLSTTRTLPYAAPDLFRIIADVDAYAEFLPHCAVSRVTHWRGGDDNGGGSDGGSDGGSGGGRWPARAYLTVGWGPLSQTYSSRVYCVPGCGVVEAVSGQRGRPTLTAAERAEIGLDKDENEDEDEDAEQVGQATAAHPDDTFESLVTRWTVTPLESNSRPRAAVGGAVAGTVTGTASGTASGTAAAPRTRVELHIRFQFRNPLYQLAAAQVGQEMATKMIEAFEKRVVQQLGPRRGRL